MYQFTGDHSAHSLSASSGHHPIDDRASSAQDLIARVAAAGEKLRAVCRAIDGPVLLGQGTVIENAVACFAAGGHILFEGPPGGGKTTLALALSQLFNLSSGRTQGTSDVMPSDILGGMIPGQGEDGGFKLIEGPIFNNIYLVDEANRMPEKSHSALLQAMQESRVTIFGVTRKLPKPFHVMVAQNPFQDGSVNVLPDAMMDRLMIRIDMKFADEDAEKEMIRRDMRHEPNLSNILGSDELSGIQSLVNGVTLSEDIIEAIAKIVRRTRPDNPETEKSIAGLIHGHGVGPRGLQSLASMTKAFAVMSGRAVPNSHDLGRAVDLVLPHRIKLKAHMPEKQKEQMAMVMQSITRGFDLT